MINGRTVLAVIPARGGSKGIPRKNIRETAGKPLIAWTIEAAQKSNYIDRIVLSSDDLEIIEVAQRWGCEVPFIRPAELARDDTPGMDPIIHTLQNLEKYDYIVLLQPTSPLRIASDIDQSIELCSLNNSNACVSVSETDKSPYWMYSLESNNQMTPILTAKDSNLRRQDLPTFVALNGAVYVAKCDWLLLNKTFVTNETIAYQMPKERSIDIDTDYDWYVAEVMLNLS